MLKERERKFCKKRRK